MSALSTKRFVTSIILSLLLSWYATATGAAPVFHGDLGSLVYETKPPLRKSLGLNDITKLSGSPWDGAKTIGTFGYVKYESIEKTISIAVGIRSFVTKEAAARHWEKLENQDFSALKLTRYKNQPNVYISTTEQFSSAVLYFLVNNVMFEVAVLSMSDSPLSKVKEIADRYPSWVESKLK